MAKDGQGLAVSGGAASAAALDRVIHDYSAWTGDIIGALGASVRDDPGFVLGNTALATILMLGGARGDDPAVRSAIAAAATAAGRATERERDHLRIARSLAADAMREAARICGEVLRDHPRDALALRFATDLYYYLGDASGIRDTVARALPAWTETDPLYGFILSRHAFGLEEAGELAQADSVARRALAINPRDAWATHTVAHVYEMTGRAGEGLAFLDATHADWRHGEWLAVHLGWHRALFLIELDRGGEALKGYDSFVRERLKIGFILDLIDAASLLWRLEIAGVEVGDRWRDLAGIAARRIGDHVLVFNDLHVALALAGAHDRDGLARLDSSLDAYLRGPGGDNRELAASLGRALIASVAAFAERDYAYVVRTLRPLRGDVVRIGGSHAQRDILEETLLAAALGAGESALARSMLAERAARRPTKRQERLKLSAGTG